MADHLSGIIEKLERVPGKRWCVLGRDYWCANKSNKPHCDTANSVETACQHFVILPGGCAYRKPDCPDCIAALRARAHKGSDDASASSKPNRT